MKIRLHLIGHLAPSIEAPGRMVDQWVEGFQTNAGRIDEKWQKKVGNEGHYQTRMVGAILKQYPKFVNPEFVSRSGLNAQAILLKHAEHLQHSFEKYKANLTRAYETVDGVKAKRFKEAVEANRAHYAEKMAKTTLPFTGTRAEGLGVAPVVAYWLTDDTIAPGILTPAYELIAGGPLLITKESRRGSFKSAINQRLIQAGAQIVKSLYKAIRIKEENDETNEVVQGFVDPALNLFPFETGGKSHIDYIYHDEKGFSLEVKVTQK